MPFSCVCFPFARALALTNKRLTSDAAAASRIQSKEQGRRRFQGRWFDDHWRIASRCCLRLPDVRSLSLDSAKCFD